MTSRKSFSVMLALLNDVVIQLIYFIVVEVEGILPWGEIFFGGRFRA